MANNKNRITVRMKPKTPPPPRVDPCTCGGKLGIMCSCAGTGVGTDHITDEDLTNIKNGPKHAK